ncbi:MAG: hypothetical protein FJ399_03220 [Verrucomicrobia bacterium]|nr:hypothetical protein [Verrucomicrobiota bacterium]
MKTLRRIAIFGFFAASAAATPLERPNILFVLADDVPANWIRDRPVRSDGRTRPPTEPSEPRFMVERRWFPRE